MTENFAVKGAQCWDGNFRRKTGKNSICLKKCKKKLKSMVGKEEYENVA